MPGHNGRDGRNGLRWPWDNYRSTLGSSPLHPVPRGAVYETRRDAIVAAVWTRWTHGQDLDGDMRLQARKFVQDAVANSYQVTDCDWTGAALKRLA
jgi:hypothetical protein